MKSYESLVVVGSSGSGKTTAVNGLRTPEYAGRVVIPHRYLTRPQRAGDDTVENSHLPQGAFQFNVRSGMINPYWQRTFEDERIEWYGFDRVKDRDDRLRIYSANNAFLRDINESVRPVLERGLVVVMTAEADSRAQRLQARSPDMSYAERAARLHDGGADMLLQGHVEVMTIDTSGLSEAEGQFELREIVESII